MTALRRTAAAVLLAAVILASGAAPAAAQSDDGPSWPAEQAQTELEAEIAACEALAESPAPANRADKDTLEQWSACAELENDSSPAMLDRDHVLFGSSAVTTEGFPLGSYKMHYESGGFFSVGSKVMGRWMEVNWLIGVSALRMAVWAFDWVVNGRVTDLLTGIPEGIQEALIGSGLLGGLLGPLALLTSSTAGVFLILRRRTAQGVSHLTWMLLMVGIGTVLVANADVYYEGVRDARSELSDAVVDTSGFETDTNGKIDAGKLMAPLLSAVVHDPWELLNWGLRLESQDCIDSASAVLARGSSSGSDWARRRMRGCPDNSHSATKHAHNPTPTRVIGTAIAAGTQLMIALLILSLALMALGSEVLLAAAFAVLPAAVVLAAFPGGRRIAAGWLSMLIQGIIGLAFGIVALRILEIVLVGIANSPAAQTMPLMSVLGILGVVAFFGFRYRRRLPEAGRALSQSLGGKAASVGSGGGGGAALAGAAGAAGGLLGGLALAHSAGPPGGAAALAAGARVARQATQAGVAKSAAITQAAAPNSKLAGALGSTKAAGGAGVGMAASLAAAQRLQSRGAVGRVAQEHGGVSADRSSELIDSRRKKKQLAAVTSRDATPETLAQGAVSRKRAVREAVAAHSNTPQAVRSDMAEKTRLGTMRRRFEAGAYAPPIDAELAGGGPSDVSAASQPASPSSPWDPPGGDQPAASNGGTGSEGSQQRKTAPVPEMPDPEPVPPPSPPRDHG